MPIKLHPPRKGYTPFWRVRGTYLGVRVNRSTKTGDRALAKKALDKWKREIECGEFAGPGDPTFAGAAAAYMKAGGDARPMEPLLRHFMERPLRRIDQAAIDAAAIALFPGACPATRNREVYTPVSAVLKHANVDFKIKRPKGSRGRVVTRWLWPEDAFRLFAAAATVDAEFAILLRFLCYTGCRISEALTMACDDVRLEEAFAYVRTSKNGDPRPVFLPVELVTAMESHPRGPKRGSERVFRFHQGGALRYLLSAAKLIACGKPKPKRLKHGKTVPFEPHELEWVNFHSFCHTYATWMRRYAGRDTKGLVGTGRWRSEQSASRYAHVVPSEDARAATLLPVPKLACKNGAK